MKPVKSGSAMSLVSKALNLLFRGVNDALADLDLKQTKEDDIEEDGVKGKYYLYEAGDDQTLEVKLFTIEDHPDMYVVRVQTDGEDPQEKGPIKQDEIIDFITDYADKHDLGTVADEPVDVSDIAEGTRIAVTLQRVHASKEDTINLCAIQASSNVGQSMKMVNDVLADDAFVDTITEEPVSFEIVAEGDSYDVNTTDTVDVTDTFEIMLKACHECTSNLQSMRWGAKALRTQDADRLIESLYYDLTYERDMIAEWCVEYTRVVPNLLSYDYQAVAQGDGMDYARVVAETKKQLDAYLDILECYYVNVDHDVQNVMDTWIRELRKKSNFVLERILMPDTPLDEVPSPATESIGCSTSIKIARRE